MQKMELTVTNEVGLHARPAAKFVQTANRFKSKINISKDGTTVSAKSIIGVLSLGAGKDAVVAIEVSGEDEAEAMAALRELVQSGFGEN